MTAILARRLGAFDVRRRLALTIFGAWAAVLFAAQAGAIALPQWLTVTMLFGVPLGAGLAALVRRRAGSGAAALAGATFAVAGALLAPAIVSASPKFALAMPVAALTGLFAARFPTLTLASVFAISGTYASLAAFTGAPVVTLANLLILGLWTGVLGRLVFGRRSLALRPTPGPLLLCAFFAMTAGAFLATEPLSAGIAALRQAPLYLSMVLLLAFGAFRRRTLDGLARAMAGVSLAVAAYASLRWAIGPAAAEESLIPDAFSRQYNQLAVTGEDKVRGSLPNGHLLGLWMACTIPFLVATGIAWRGGWRLVSIAALPFSAIALLGSGQRAAAVAVAAGALTVVLVHLVARGFRGPRLGVALGAVAALVAIGVVAYPSVLDDPEQRKRYENILTPGRDGPFQERLHKWRETLAVVDEEPFGRGLGAGNAQAGRRFADIASINIDNSYLMIAYDQGLLVMAFFVVTLIVLLAELIRYAVWTRGPNSSAMATAGAGTLVALLIDLMSANYITGRPVTAGWLIVGLGVAQYASHLGSEQPESP